MEFATSMQDLPFKKKLRSGQARVIAALSHYANQLNIKLPTGYGKTYTACCVYAWLKRHGRATRLLYVVANTAQLNQFCNDAGRDLADAGIDGPHVIFDISHKGARLCLKAHREGACQVFVVMIQALREKRGFELASALMETGQWMLCIDEYHHYGIDKSWGRAALALNRAFLLCMSATPTRPGDDSAFGVPHISVTYREAEEEKAVKPLRGHAYNYRVDLEVDGDVFSCETQDLADMAGGDSPEKIDRFLVERKMRWSPKYISPLVAIPIERMLRERVATGHRLQALVGAMSVSHAGMVCKQIQDMFPELSVDWVGTGERGKSDEENAKILAEFCPAKDEDGRRAASTLDVLVHVGMAGEGLDCIPVSEIVCVNSASINNRNLQIYGRAARYLLGVGGHINFDGSSEFAKKGYTGSKIMDAMDFKLPLPEDDGDDNDAGGDGGDYEPLPIEPIVKIFNIELVDINSGDAGVQRMAKILHANDPQRFDIDTLMANPNDPKWMDVLGFYRAMRTVEAREHNDRSTVEQLNENVNVALVAVTRLTLMKLGARAKGQPFDRSLSGTVKTEINKRKKRLHGEVCKDKEVLEKHYGWLKQLERDILENGVPSWLATLVS